MELHQNSLVCSNKTKSLFCPVEIGDCNSPSKTTDGDTKVADCYTLNDII